MKITFTAMNMEHVKDHPSLIQIMKEKLSSSGIVAVVVHNHRAILNRLLGKHSPIIDTEHLQLFFEKLFTEAGLEPMGIEAFSNTYPLRYWVRLLPLPSVLKRGLIHILEFFILCAYVSYYASWNMLGIARKTS